jgi:hypothetical protein
VIQQPIFGRAQLDAHPLRSLRAVETTAEPFIHLQQRAWRIRHVGTAHRLETPRPDSSRGLKYHHHTYRRLATDGWRRAN